MPLPPSQPTDFAQDSLGEMLGRFSGPLGREFVVAVMENEKKVFVVRREDSLEETRIQFLRQCEKFLLQALSEIQNGQSPDWSPGHRGGT